MHYIYLMLYTQLISQLKTTTSLPIEITYSPTTPYHQPTTTSYMTYPTTTPYHQPTTTYSPTTYSPTTTTYSPTTTTTLDSLPTTTTTLDSLPTTTTYSPTTTTTEPPYIPCGTDGIWYLPLNMPGQSRTVGDPAQCQQRCRDTNGCRYFNSFPNGGCHISTGAEGSILHSENPTAVSGSAYCTTPGAVPTTYSPTTTTTLDSLPPTDVTLTIDIDGNNLYYKSNVDIGGFQFKHDDCISDVGGGDVAANGFTISNEILEERKNLVMAFSLAGSFIPAGEGTLLSFKSNCTPLYLQNIIISDRDGNELPYELNNDSIKKVNEIMKEITFKKSKIRKGRGKGRGRGRGRGQGQGQGQGQERDSIKITASIPKKLIPNIISKI